MVDFTSGYWVVDLLLVTLLDSVPGKLTLPDGMPGIELDQAIYVQSQLSTSKYWFVLTCTNDI